MLNIQHTHTHTVLHLLLQIAAKHGHREVVVHLLKAGANANAVNNRGGTPLHAAVCAGHLRLVQLLLDAGTDPNIARTDDGASALHDACAMTVVDKNIVRVLLGRGASPSARTHDGLQPLTFVVGTRVPDGEAAQDRSSIAQLLMSATAAAVGDGEGRYHSKAREEQEEGK